MTDGFRTFDKEEVARRQLGAALHLFIEDADPVSVHVLACGGSEIAGALVEKRGRLSFREISIQTNPNLDEALYRRLKSQVWNAFKHNDHSNGKARDDSELFAEFSDEYNGIFLFVGWYDLVKLSGALPIEAQCFMNWFLAINPDFVRDQEQAVELALTFPNILGKGKGERKKLLQRCIRLRRETKHVMSDPRTEHRKLLLPSDLDQFRRA